VIKIDLKKELKHLYYPSTQESAWVDVPRMSFLMIDGSGDPNTSKDFQDALEALYSLSYTLKFMVKKQSLVVDYVVMPLEGLWWADDMALFSTEKKNDWKWTLMIMQPELVTATLFQQGVQQVSRKKSLPALVKVRLENYHEGPSAQIMHIGSFSTEGPTVERLHRFIREQGWVHHGKHHEIYLSDFRKTAPEKIKTVIRQPVLGSPAI
jgi:hypothetical protein